MIKKLLINAGAFLLLAFPVLAQDQGGVPTDENSTNAPAASSSASENYLTVPTSTPDTKAASDAPAAKEEVKDTAEEAQPNTVEAKPKKSVRKRAASSPTAKGDVAGIQKLFNAFSEAWASGDAKKVASHWVIDGTYLNLFGQPAGDREEIEQLLATDLQLLKGSTLSFTDFKYRFVLGGFALVDASGDIAGMKNADGSDVPDNPIHVYSALANRGGKWYFLSLRPYAFARAPASASAPQAAPAASAPPASSTAPAAAPPLPASSASGTTPAASLPPLPDDINPPADNAKSKLDMDKKQ